jgi:predicted GH43/DUF377 family glycosyl hydrolase
MPIGHRFVNTYILTIALMWPMVGGAQTAVFDPERDQRAFRNVLDIPGHYVNDHSLIWDSGLWHLFFILGDVPPNDRVDSARVACGREGNQDADVHPEQKGWSRDGNEIVISHATSRDLRTWRLEDPAIRIGSSGEIDAGHVYAPSVIRADSSYVMIYTATDGSHFRAEHLCLAESKDLYSWTRRGDSAIFKPDSNWALYYADHAVEGRPGPVSFRDPYIIRDDRHGYICYYVARLRGNDSLKSRDGSYSCIAVATSPDLKHWIDRGPILIRPTYSSQCKCWTHPESPCVVKMGRRWALFWNCGPGTCYALGTEPLKFDGESAVFLATSHASRVVKHEESWYITSCSRKIADPFRDQGTDRTCGLFMARLKIESRRSMRMSIRPLE